MLINNNNNNMLDVKSIEDSLDLEEHYNNFFDKKNQKGCNKFKNNKKTIRSNK